MSCFWLEFGLALGFHTEESWTDTSVVTWLEFLVFPALQGYQVASVLHIYLPIRFYVRGSETEVMEVGKQKKDINGE